MLLLKRGTYKLQPSPLALGETTSIDELKSLLIRALREDKRFAEELAEILFNHMADRIADMISERFENES
jgi:hypothetical protein